MWGLPTSWDNMPDESFQKFYRDGETMGNQGLGLVFRGKHVNGHVETVKIWVSCMHSWRRLAIPGRRGSWRCCFRRRQVSQRRDSHRQPSEVTAVFGWSVPLEHSSKGLACLESANQRISATVARRLLPALSRFRGLPSLPSEGWPSVLRQLPSPHTPRAVDAIPPNLTA